MLALILAWLCGSLTMFIAVSLAQYIEANVLWSVVYGYLAGYITKGIYESMKRREEYE